MYGRFACMLLCASHACSVLGGQKKVPWELKLWMVVSFRVGAGN